MFARDQVAIPVEISRDAWIGVVFTEGERCGFGWDTLLISVQIGDRFMDVSERRVWTGSSKGVSEPCMRWPMVPAYSEELAHVCLALASKANEDDPYATKDVAYNVANGIVYKMEWEIAINLRWRLPVATFFSNWDRWMVWLGISGMPACSWGELALHTAHRLMGCSPLAIIMALGLIWKRRGRLEMVVHARCAWHVRWILYLMEQTELPYERVRDAWIGARSL